MDGSPQDPKFPVPPGFQIGAIYRLPDGRRGRFLGCAEYEVHRIGVHAGTRRYVWRSVDRTLTLVLAGPLAFDVFSPHGGAYVAGYRRDQFPASGPLELPGPAEARS